MPSRSAALPGWSRACAPDDLAVHVVSAAVARGQLEPASVDEVYLGAANGAGEDIGLGKGSRDQG
jgi:hypothetical protein